MFSSAFNVGASYSAGPTGNNFPLLTNRCFGSKVSYDFLRIKQGSSSVNVKQSLRIRDVGESAVHAPISELSYLIRVS